MSGPPIDPDTRTFDPDPVRVAAVTRYAMARFAPNRATGATDTCLYTNTPDEHFVLDRRGLAGDRLAVQRARLQVHALIGRILADLATGWPAPIPLERFLSTRPALVR